VDNRAQRIEWLFVYEIAIASAEPKLAPYFAPSMRTLYPRLFIARLLCGCAAGNEKAEPRRQDSAICANGMDAAGSAASSMPAP
jgi:hypothetical protein